MSPHIWALLAAVIAVAAEYLYRTLPGPWWHYLWIWTPFQLMIGYSIYKLVTLQSGSLLDAFIVWAFSTTAMRVAITVLVLRDQVKGGTWFALGLLVMARIAQSFWGR